VSTILLGVSGSVAVYKACEVASTLTQQGHTVRTVLTPRAAQLVSPQLFEALTGDVALSDEFSAERRGSMDHIDLATGVDLFVVCPCTADLAARLALGLADDLVATSALALAPGTPRLVCPAMNPHMLAAPATQRNLEILRGDGWQVVEPEEGHMACGVDGKGRLAAPATIVSRIVETLR
jgi:phosphopantothenoylcysteine decarboxylase/phosphopantothenate--cysteine ligase